MIIESTEAALEIDDPFNDLMRNIVKTAENAHQKWLGSNENKIFEDWCLLAINLISAEIRSPRILREVIDDLSLKKRNNYWYEEAQESPKPTEKKVLRIKKTQGGIFDIQKINPYVPRGKEKEIPVLLAEQFTHKENQDEDLYHIE